MARRRMFSFEQITSDRFLNLSIQAQAFYVHLCIHADDEGFVAAPSSLGRLLGVGAQELGELIRSGFVISFDTGVVLITDWLLHNTIRKDRSVETHHRVERSMVQVVDGRYVLVEQTEDTAVTTKMAAENGKIFSDISAPQNRIDQNISDNNISDHNISDQSTIDQVLTDEAYMYVVEHFDEIGWRDRNKNSNLNSYENAPSIEQVREYFKQSGFGLISADAFWNYFQRKRWRDQNGEPIVNWQSMANRWNDRKPAQ